MSKVLNQMAKTARTWNGAVSNSTTGFEKYSTCLDYFFKAGTCSKREQSVVDTDMGRIFDDDTVAALKIVFGTRLITRKPNDLEDVQTGYGRRDEFYKSVVWLHHHKPDLLYKNLHLIPIFGSWKDFLQEPLIDVLNREKVYELFAENLNDNLLLKYLPQVTRSKKNVRSERDKKRVIWAKGFCVHLNISPKEYRRMKSTGAAHVWQRQMGRGEWDAINFNGIPGKAMLQHTSLKGKDKMTVFERHGQVERLKEWVSKQKTVKFTGYPYELLKAVYKNPTFIQRLIYDKQFEHLLENMKKHSLGNVLACLDISGSMSAPVTSDGTSAYDICISMGICFSALNVGYFKDVVCAFSDRPIVSKLKGGFCDRVDFIRNDSEIQSVGWGSTNFQGVINLLCEIKRNDDDIPASEFPQTILVISDMQFNATGSAETNYEAARRKLKAVGLDDMRIIWWCVNGKTSDFPSVMSDKGVYMMGGFDPNTLRALMGLNTKDKQTKDFDAVEKKEETPLDGMMNFLSQPIFDLLQY